MKILLVIDKVDEYTTNVYDEDEDYLFHLPTNLVDTFFSEDATDYLDLHGRAWIESNEHNVIHWSLA